MIRSYKISVNTSGADGSATGNAHSDQFSGRILSVTLIPHGSAPGTTDTVVKITEDGDYTSVLETVMTFTDTNSNSKVYPRHEIQDNTGSNAAAANKTNVWEPYVTVNGVYVSVAGCNELTGAVEVEVIVEE